MTDPKTFDITYPDALPGVAATDAALTPKPLEAFASDVGGTPFIVIHPASVEYQYVANSKD